ncbi:major facilitator superfamily domain-containing protein [Pseudoneurospora amorphoporcata]|uniref:Major facilitator superfamily domain-containing protein n=1 Tax=Pseudoneurospora amorphoporcata TaxID=241081 RepID=A0AAN6NQY5_9PEZI|nr:major facilitator superfamily domain-containing protein [Pseudoneurospora amorphoporcata]
MLDSLATMAPNLDVYNGSTTGSGDEALVVMWDGPDDVQHPRNWTPVRKWRNVLLISIQATLSPMASVVLAVGGQAVADDFGLTDEYTPTLPTALFVLGFGLGPLYLAPLSELYGRRAVYLSCFAMFTVFNICCAVSPNIAALTVFRLLAGMAGSAGPSIGGGTIGDMYSPERRGRAQALYSFGPTGGSAIGGVVGGFILRGTGSWRWLAWIMAMASGLTSLASVFLLHETYAPFLLRKKAAALTKSGVPCVHVQAPGPVPDRGSCCSDLAVVLRTMTRAAMMLFTSPVCTAMSLYMAVIYGILYLHMVTLPLLFSAESLYGLPSYRWPEALTGLSYLGVGLGSVAGALLSAALVNRTYASMKARHGATSRHAHGDAGAGGGGAHPNSEDMDDRTPEYRMPFMQVGALIVPAGLLIFALTAGKDNVHWMVPLVGAAVFSTGMLMTYISVTTYMVDSFETYAASALAAVTVSRSVLGCIFAFVGNGLYRRLGYEWGTLLLFFLCLVITPLPTVFYYWGPRLRKIGPFAKAAPGSSNTDGARPF